MQSLLTCTENLQNLFKIMLFFVSNHKVLDIVIMICWHGCSYFSLFLSYFWRVKVLLKTHKAHLGDINKLNHTKEEGEEKGNFKGLVK